MKSLKLLIGAATVAAIWASPASAAQICNGCNYLPAAAGTYIGTYTSTNFDFGSFVNASPGGGVAGTTFTDTYVFDFTPIGSASISASFTPIGTGISSFAAMLYSLPSATCTTFVTPPTSSAGTACTSVPAGTLVATGTLLGSSSQIGNTALSSGRYALRISGTNASGQSANYTGNLAVNPVPEPGSLALVGAALFAAALSVRMRKAA